MAFLILKTLLAVSNIILLAFVTILAWDHYRSHFNMNSFGFAFHIFTACWLVIRAIFWVATICPIFPWTTTTFYIFYWMPAPVEFAAFMLLPLYFAQVLYPVLWAQKWPTVRPYYFSVLAGIMVLQALWTWAATLPECDTTQPHHHCFQTEDSSVAFRVVTAVCFFLLAVMQARYGQEVLQLSETDPQRYAQYFTSSPTVMSKVNSFLAFSFATRCAYQLVAMTTSFDLPDIPIDSTDGDVNFLVFLLFELWVYVPTGLIVSTITSQGLSRVNSMQQPAIRYGLVQSQYGSVDAPGTDSVYAQADGDDVEMHTNTRTTRTSGELPIAMTTAYSMPEAVSLASSVASSQFEHGTTDASRNWSAGEAGNSSNLMSSFPHAGSYLVPHYERRKQRSSSTASDTSSADNAANIHFHHPHGQHNPLLLTHAHSTPGLSDLHTGNGASIEMQMQRAGAGIAGTRSADEPSTNDYHNHQHPQQHQHTRSLSVGEHHHHPHPHSASRWSNIRNPRSTHRGGGRGGVSGGRSRPTSLYQPSLDRLAEPSVDTSSVQESGGDRSRAASGADATTATNTASSISSISTNTSASVSAMSMMMMMTPSAVSANAVNGSSNSAADHDDHHAALRVDGNYELQVEPPATPTPPPLQPLPTPNSLMQWQAMFRSPASSLPRSGIAYEQLLHDEHDDHDHDEQSNVHMQQLQQQQQQERDEVFGGGAMQQPRPSRPVHASAIIGRSQSGDSLWFEGVNSSAATSMNESSVLRTAAQQQQQPLVMLMAAPRPSATRVLPRGFFSDSQSSGQPTPTPPAMGSAMGMGGGSRSGSSAMMAFSPSSALHSEAPTPDRVEAAQEASRARRGGQQRNNFASSPRW